MEGVGWGGSGGAVVGGGCGDVEGWGGGGPVEVVDLLCDVADGEGGVGGFVVPAEEAVYWGRWLERAFLRGWNGRGW